MRSNWSLDTTDGFKIHGLLNQPITGKSDKAVLIVHGMTGSAKEEQHEATATGDYIKIGESYHNFVKTTSDMKIVEGTDHCFVEPGTTEPLLNYTREWFEKFQPQ